jgi:hypothetical protein
MIAGPEDRRKLRETHFLRDEFIMTRRRPMTISVPPLTQREKHWLDSQLDAGLRVRSLPFEIEPEFLANYRKFYKQYPTFVEALM